MVAGMGCGLKSAEREWAVSTGEPAPQTPPAAELCGCRCSHRAPSCVHRARERHLGPRMHQHRTRAAEWACGLHHTGAACLQNAAAASGSDLAPRPAGGLRWGAWLAHTRSMPAAMRSSLALALCALLAGTALGRLVDRGAPSLSLDAHDMQHDTQGPSDTGGPYTDEAERDRVERLPGAPPGPRPSLFAGVSCIWAACGARG